MNQLLPNKTAYKGYISDSDISKQSTTHIIFYKSYLINH